VPVLVPAVVVYVNGATMWANNVPGSVPGGTKPGKTVVVGAVNSVPVKGLAMATAVPKKPIDNTMAKGVRLRSSRFRIFISYYLRFADDIRR